MNGRDDLTGLFSGPSDPFDPAGRSGGSGSPDAPGASRDRGDPGGFGFLERFAERALSSFSGDLIVPPGSGRGWVAWIAGHGDLVAADALLVRVVTGDPR
jgi:hypothetical protein